MSLVSLSSLGWMNMNGIIGIEGLRIWCVIGANASERIIEQEIFVDLQVETSFQACAASDKVEDAISYVDLADVCTQLAKTRQYHLLETFACEAVDALLRRFPVDWAWIRVRKPHAVITAEAAFVELKRYAKGS